VSVPKQQSLQCSRCLIEMALSFGLCLACKFKDQSILETSVKALQMHGVKLLNEGVRVHTSIINQLEL